MEITQQIDHLDSTALQSIVEDVYDVTEFQCLAINGRIPDRKMENEDIMHEKIPAKLSSY